MQDYPGVAAPTVSTTPGDGAPGVVVSTGPTDPYGYFPTTQEVQDGDRRDENNYDPPIEALVDRSNWFAWRTPDWIRGGDYTSVLTGDVALGVALTVTQGFTASAATGQNAGQFTGASGTIALTVSSTLATAIDASSTHATAIIATVASGDGTAVIGEGSGAGAGADFTGGATNGHGVTGTAGGAGGSGVKGVAFAPGQTSLWAADGPIKLDTSVGATTDDPGVDQIWPESIPKAFAYVALDGAGNITVDVFGLNIESVIFSDVGGGGNYYSIKFTLKRSMLVGNYVVNVTPVGFSSGPAVPKYDIISASEFTVGFIDLNNLPDSLSLWNDVSNTGPTGSFGITVMGRQA